MVDRSLRPPLLRTAGRWPPLLAIFAGPLQSGSSRLKPLSARKRGPGRRAPLVGRRPAAPIAPTDWSYHRAAHLLERAGFGATPEEIARFAAMSPQRAVDELVNYESIDNRRQPPFDE